LTLDYRIIDEWRCEEKEGKRVVDEECQSSTRSPSRPISLEKV
jgi:hypothetical protein